MQISGSVNLPGYLIFICVKVIIKYVKLASMMLYSEQRFDVHTHMCVSLSCII